MAVSSYENADATVQPSPLVATPVAERPGSALDCSVGIMAYNEEANIADAIDSIRSQRVAGDGVRELIVVASGCEDRTAQIVAELADRDPRVRLIEQERREGKASAVNLFIAAARCPILVLVSADVLVQPGAIDVLVRHFEDPTVGMAGGRPIPVNDESTLLGHAVHLQWRLHDRLARETPKLGEMVAFRNIVPRIPHDTAVDELSIQALVEQLGYRLVYEPQAVVYNRGPSTLGDFLRQRRRIYAGHLRVAEQQRYCAPTMSMRRLLRALAGSRSFATPRCAVLTVATIALEAMARGLGRYDALRRRPQHVWEMCPTTKRYITDAANPDNQHNVLVFHIVELHRHELELGLHGARQLTQRLSRQVKDGLGAEAIVSIRRRGTIVAVMPGERAAAEAKAREVMQRLEAAAVAINGHGAAAVAKLACGIISFRGSATPVVESIELAALNGDLATSG